jgi:uncharacterized repeat protein (TIGR01451 family)
VDPAHPGGSISNTASVSADENDPDSSNNSATQDTTVNVPPQGTADLELQKTVKDSKPRRDSEATYLIDVTNHGPNAATDVVVTDALPDGLEFVSADPSQGTYDSGSGDWAVGNLAADGSASMRLVTKVVGTSDQITNVVVVKGLDQTDPRSGNDTSDAVVEVLGSGGHHGGGGGNGGTGGKGGDPDPASGADPQVAGNSGFLAFTGRDIAATAAGGVFLLGLGILLLLLGRRRRDEGRGSNAVRS